MKDYLISHIMIPIWVLKMVRKPVLIQFLGFAWACPKRRWSEIKIWKTPTIVRSLLYLMRYESWGMSHGKPFKKCSAQSRPISLGINSSWYHGATVMPTTQDATTIISTTNTETSSTPVQTVEIRLPSELILSSLRLLLKNKYQSTNLQINIHLKRVKKAYQVPIKLLLQ